MLSSALRTATTSAAAALLALASFGAVHAQADGAAPAVQVDADPRSSVPALPKEQRLALGTGPEAALMNDLQARMKQIQATADPMLRQQRMDEFLKTLRQGMASIAKQPVPGAGR